MTRPLHRRRQSGNSCAECFKCTPGRHTTTLEPSIRRHAMGGQLVLWWTLPRILHYRSPEVYNFWLWDGWGRPPIFEGGDFGLTTTNYIAKISRNQMIIGESIDYEHGSSSNNKQNYQTDTSQDVEIISNTRLFILQENHSWKKEIFQNWWNLRTNDL